MRRDRRGVYSCLYVLQLEGVSTASRRASRWSSSAATTGEGWARDCGQDCGLYFFQNVPSLCVVDVSRSRLSGLRLTGAQRYYNIRLVAVLFWCCYLQYY